MSELGTKDLTVLAVDDDEGIREILTQMLKRDYKIETVESVAEAKQILVTHPPDLIITDLVMPKETGIDLLKYVVEKHPDVPVVMLTGRGDKESAVSALRLRAFDYLDKPFNREIILASLGRAAQMILLRLKMKDAQARSIESEKLATVGLVTMSIMHELATPITVLNSVAGSLQKRIGQDKGFESLAKDADKIFQTANHILKVVKNIRNISRQKKGDLQKIPFDAVIQNAYELCKETLKHGRVNFIQDYTSPLPDVEINASEVIQVLINLFVNGTHAVEKLEDRWIKVQVKQDGDNLHVSITDSGPGIPKEHRDKMFKPFFTTKELGKGTGLGLSTSLNIIRSYGGDLFINDKSPNTCFVISLPFGGILQAPTSVPA